MVAPLCELLIPNFPVTQVMLVHDAAGSLMEFSLNT